MCNRLFMYRYTISTIPISCIIAVPYILNKLHLQLLNTKYNPFDIDTVHK